MQIDKETVYLDGTGTLGLGGVSGAYEFDGSDDWMDVTSPNPGFFHDTFTERTVVFRVKKLKNGERGTLYDEGGSVNGYYVGLTGGGNVKLAVRESSNQTNAFAKLEADGEYHTVVASFKDSELFVSVDGKHTGSATHGTTQINDHGSDPGFFRSVGDDANDNSAQYLNLETDYILVSDGAGKQVEYDFSNVSGDTVPDTSGNGRDGTLKNGPTSRAQPPVSLWVDGLEANTLSEWNPTDLTRVSDFARGNFAGYSSSSGGSQPRASTQPNIDTAKPKLFEFWYRETGSSTGSMVLLKDENGNEVIGAGTDNPQWDIRDGNSGQGREINSGTDYRRFIRVRFGFNWNAGSDGTADVEFYDPTAQKEYAETGLPLRGGAGIDTIEIWDYNGGALGGSAIDTWHDDFLLKETAADPSNLVIDRTYATSLYLRWDGEYPAYDVYISESSGNSTGDYNLENGGVAQGNEYNVDGIEAGEKYYMRVANAGESEVTNEVNVVTVLRGPDNPQANVDSNDNISVSWEKDDNSSDGNFEIYRSTSSGSLGGLLTTITDLSRRSYTDTSANQDTTYYYTIRRNTDHASADSPQTDGTTIVSTTWVDDFEDQDAGEYSFDQGSASRIGYSSSQAVKGSVAMSMSGGNVEMYSENGLDNYPGEGDTYRVFNGMDGTVDVNLRYYGQDYKNCYFVRLPTPTTEFFSLYKLTSHTAEKIKNENPTSTPNYGEMWEYRVTVSNGTHTLEAYDSNGNLQKSFQANDSQFTASGGTGIGFDAYIGSSGNTVYWDGAEIL